MSKGYRILLASVLVIILAAWGTLAGDKSEINHDKKEISQTEQVLKRLSHGIDLWHDANLKGDQHKIDEYHQGILNIIRVDVKATRELVNSYEKEAVKSAGNKRSEFRDDAVD